MTIKADDRLPGNQLQSSRSKTYTQIYNIFRTGKIFNKSLTKESPLLRERERLPLSPPNLGDALLFLYLYHKPFTCELDGDSENLIRFLKKYIFK